MTLRPGTYAHQDRLRAHLLAELRDTVGELATTVQLAGQVPAPWLLDHQPGDAGADAAYVYPHLRALEAQGLVRRVTSASSREVAWRPVHGDTERVRLGTVRR